ncbi:hypothetical protein F5148DRAFT_1313626 [Russula earlei]|uniref:Uncharacterized protein n=1 Tax=Russula earlei TaxID=71964 RepID=A0ACC0U4H3_9AGAM|nr:hypothetical protein F5148DRAFT_1313626 [Russula earlei]
MRGACSTRVVRSFLLPAVVVASHHRTCPAPHMDSFSDGPSLDIPFHSSPPNDMRQHLQLLLDGKEKQLQQAAALGERLLAQRVELEERVRLLQDMDVDKTDEITADMRERYRELADAVSAWDFGNGQLTAAFTSSNINGSIATQSFEVHDPLRDEPERPKPAPGTSAAQSRRAKNAAHRADDVEFAFEIGSGLLTEVRRLQSLLAERDKVLQDMKEEKDDLEKTLESLRSALKSQEQSTDKYKEENWNLEVTLQELRIQFSDSQSTVQRLESEHKRLTRQLNKAREATDQHKNEAERLKGGLEDLKANHETTIAQARKQAASLQRDKSDLQQSLDTLKAEMARLNRRLPRMGSPMTPEGRERSDLLTPNDREVDDVFSPAPSTNRRRGDTSAMFSADGEYDSSPDASPSRPFQAPNHPSNEVEALQQRLSHAQRQINTLKSTLQREKELKIEYRKRLDGSPAVSTDLHTEEYVTDEDTEDGTPGTGKKPRPLASFRAARGGRGRTRGRGGVTLTQRLEHAARSPASEYDGDDDDLGAVTSTPPQVPSLPIFFGGGAEADDEPEPDYHDDDTAPVDLAVSNRGSLDGLDPAFANVLRRSSSSGSLPYNRSPLRQAVVSRSVPRRSRGGAAFQEARPASLVGQPAALDAELFGIGMDSVAETETPVTIAEFGCQTEIEEVTPVPIHVTPPAPETADFGVQVEQEIPELKLMADTEVQTVPEPIPLQETKVIIERAEVGVQYQYEAFGPSPLYTESSVETGPITEHEDTIVTSSDLPPLSSQAGVQTPPVQTAHSQVQTLPLPVPEKINVETQTVHSQDDDAITRSVLPHDTSEETIIFGGRFATERDQGDEELDDGATETGIDTDTEADYQDARQSILLATPTASMEDDYQSIHTFSERGGEGDDDDAESIKASLLAYRHDAVDEESRAITPPESARIDTPPPQIRYESQAVQVDPPEGLGPAPISTPEPEPIPAPEQPKPALREISVQTDKWVPTPPASPAHPRGSTLLGFKPAGTGAQQFQYIAPLSAGPAAPVTPTHSVPPSPSAVRDSVATIIPPPRLLTHDRRQSIESALSGADESTRSRVPSISPAPVDKSRPPMMMLPPPPRAPPPNSMPPPQLIPERRIPVTSVSSHDAAPGRPTSPPPAELIQRATTPTFGSLRGNLPRQHGSSLPPSAQGFPSRPSTHSFRSGAHPTVVSIFSGRDRDRVKGMSTTSLQSDRSLGSGRSSVSSDNHYYPARSQSRATNVPPAATSYPQNGSANPHTRGTDPAILHAITQTMIGEFLYKYTRRTIGKGHGERRHKRFFWVHPYTRTLYWSDSDPGSSNVSESSAKSAYIESVRSVLDPNPLPPGLHQYSVVVSTPFREMKFTAPSKERHDIWINALQYLLTRPGPPTTNGPNGTITGPGAAPLNSATGHTEVPVKENHPDHNSQLLSSPQSFRSGRSIHLSGGSWDTTPRGQRSASQLSVGGSIGKRSGTPAAEYLRYPGPDGPYSPTKSFEQVQVDVGGDGDLNFELHEETLSENEFEGLENVRACCDGLHTVGGAQYHHPHHHPHRDDPPSARPQTRDGRLDAHPEPPRPSSPAWSFRSHSGSTTSHDGGLFSGRLRFGSRRSAKVSTATSAMEVHSRAQHT